MINKIIGLILLIFISIPVLGQSSISVSGSEEPLAVGPKVKWDKTILEMGEMDFKVEKKGEFTSHLRACFVRLHYPRLQRSTYPSGPVNQN